MKTENFIAARGLFIAVTKYGVKNLRLNKKNISFTIPKNSELIDVNGNEISGELLAKKVIKMYSSFGVKFNFDYEIREEKWTKEKSQNTEKYAKGIYNILTFEF